jgi:ADP-heptose:LPS heptosyltransferase
MAGARPGLFSLQETAAALASAKAVVAGDTGVMHMATAMRTPVVTLFGPTVRAFGFGPYRAPATVLERDPPMPPLLRPGRSRLSTRPPPLPARQSRRPT